MNEFKTWLESKYLEWQQQSGRRRTVAEFADYLGLQRSILSHYLNGRNIPSYENARKLAALGPEVYDILGLVRPDPFLEEVREWYDTVIPSRKDHFVATVRELAELEKRIEKDKLQAKLELDADFRTQQLAVRSLVKEIRAAKTRNGVTRGAISIILPGSEIEVSKDLTFG